MDKEYVSLAGEYAVASEICRRNYFAQVTYGNRKQTDILVFSDRSSSYVKVEVKSKLGNEWPQVKGIPTGNSHILILVDFSNKKEGDRPDFFVMDGMDWQEFLKYIEKLPKFSGLLANGYTPTWNGGKYKGTGVKPEMIGQHSEKWEKLDAMIQ